MVARLIRYALESSSHVGDAGDHASVDLDGYQCDLT
jgi:hypothetical protein